MTDTTPSSFDVTVSVPFASENAIAAVRASV